MKVVVIGANGQLGADVIEAVRAAGYETVGLTHSEIEVADADAVGAVIGQAKADAIINTAAFHNVEACEREPERAFAINGLGCRNLATAARKHDAYLLHVSTDYVFDGSKKAPYVEADAPLPLNTYGITKLAGEYYVLGSEADAAVLRVSGVYGTYPCRAKGGLNFVQLMLKLARERPEIRVVDDEVLTPTYSIDIARQIVAMVEAKATGLFHGTSQGACSWYEFAAAVFAESGVSANLQKARPGEFPAKVARPSFSVLDNARLRQVGLDCMPAWRDGLQRYLSTAKDNAL